MKTLPLLSLMLLILATGCEKDNQTGSISGSISLEVVAKHHSWGVGGLSVFLKDNVTQFPGYDTSLYRWRMTTDPSGHTSFDSLFPGDYYVYAIGYDSIWGDSVIGYMPVSINSQQLDENTMNIELYVSE